MTKENQHNSNLPDPDKPWCIKCSRHTRYESKYHRNENNTGHYTYKCRKCDGVIYTINDAKYYIGIIKIKTGCMFYLLSKTSFSTENESTSSKQPIFTPIPFGSDLR